MVYIRVCGEMVLGGEPISQNRDPSTSSGLAMGHPRLWRFGRNAGVSPLRCAPVEMTRLWWVWSVQSKSSCNCKGKSNCKK